MWFHFPGQTVFDGGVAWVFLAVSIAFAVLAVNAYFPVRREPFTVVSFALGWIPGELPLHVGAVEVVGLAAFAQEGALRTWPGWVGTALVVASCAALVELALVAHRSRDLVEAALEDATGGAIDVEGFERTAGMEPVVAAGDRRSAPIPRYPAGPEHRLLGGRELPTQARHPEPPLGPPGAGARPGLHPWGCLDDGGQAATGDPDDARAGPAGLVVRGHQLPAEPEGHLARPHRRLQAGHRLGSRPHRRLRRRPRVHRRLRRLGWGPPVGAAGPHPRRGRMAARLRGPGHLGRRLRPLLRRLRHDRRPVAVGSVRPRPERTPRAPGDEDRATPTTRPSSSRRHPTTG